MSTNLNDNRHVLVADYHDDRANCILGLLESEYGVHANRVTTWQAMRENLKQWEDKYHTKTHLLILAEDLPGTGPQSPLNQKLAVRTEFDWGGRFATVLVLVFTTDAAEMKDADSRGVYRLESTATFINETAFREFLSREVSPHQGPLLHKRPNPPAVVLGKPNDYRLIDRIRALDPTGELEQGMARLGRISRLLWPDSTTIVLHPFPQGRSGASVFLTEVLQHGTSPGWFVIKTTEAKSYYKIANSVKHAAQIGDYLNVPCNRINPNQIHAAVLHKPSSGSPLVRSGEFYAAAFHFIGDIHRHDDFYSLERLYQHGREAPKELRAGFCLGGETLTQAVVRDLLAHLRTSWYQQGLSESKSCPLWTSEPLSETAVPNPPPYGLSLKNRNKILGFLDEYSYYGQKLVPDWDKTVETIRRWLFERGRLPGSFGENRNILLTPAHGDLNRLNVLFWIPKAQFFLLDFDNYQPLGHPLQDFAQLETELKINLLDNEQNGQKCLDLHGERFSMWLDLENDWLKQLRSGEPPREVTDQSVLHCFNLVEFIRTEACAAYKTIAGNDDEKTFRLEYSAALLNRTLRAIAHAPPSLLKGLLAVHSSARLIANSGATTAL